MFRHRLRPELPPLDEATAERLLDRRELPARTPETYRPVAEVLAAASAPPTEAELQGAAAAAAAFVTAHAAAVRPARRTRSVAALAVTGFLLVASTGTAVAATEGALPQPVQAVAHEALGVVGISVPGVTPEHPDPAITATLEDGQGDEPPDGSATVPWSTGTSTGTSTASASADAGDGVAKDTPIGGDTGGTDGGAADDPAVTPAADQPTDGTTDTPDDSQPVQDPKPEPAPRSPRPAPEPKPAPQPKEPEDPKSAPSGRTSDPTGPR
jgi:hypothetical protein